MSKYAEEVMKLRRRVTEQGQIQHMLVRQMQAAYSAGMRDGPRACMTWLGNALTGPGALPYEGADPDWYSSDAWSTFPYPKPSYANATVNDGRCAGDTQESFEERKRVET